MIKFQKQNKYFPDRKGSKAFEMQICVCHQYMPEELNIAYCQKIKCDQKLAKHDILPYHDQEDQGEGGSICHTEDLKLCLKDEVTDKCQAAMGPVKIPGIFRFNGQRARGLRNKSHVSSLYHWENNNVT